MSPSTNVTYTPRLKSRTDGLTSSRSEEYMPRRLGLGIIDRDSRVLEGEVKRHAFAELATQLRLWLS